MRFTPKLRSAYHLMVLLVAAWIIIFIYQERYRPYSAISNCQWPEIIDHGTDESPADLEVSHILLIADPQLIDNHTYPGRWGPLLSLSKHTADIYLKKNYRSLMNILEPENVMFLGDYLDNGRSSSQTYYANELKRFNKIFANKKANIYWTNVPGNHDIGFGDAVKLPARERFNKDFGPTNQMIEINHVEFVAVDTLSLSSSDTEINKESRAFIDSVQKLRNDKPRVLLSHVPLFRDPAKQTCGPLREQKKWHMSAGYQYQSVLDKDISTELLQKIDPDLIFSGDDHDYCDIEHEPHISGDSHRAREITVKSISMAMGIKYPAVQLLSIGYNKADKIDNSKSRTHYETEMCYLTTPYIDIFTYIVMAVVSGLLLLWWNLSHRQSNRFNSYLPIGAGFPLTGIHSGTTKEPSNSIKLSNFLRAEQDPGLLKMPTSLYETPKESSKVKKLFIDISHSLQRSGIVGFFKHSTLMAVTVISIYYFGFCLTI